MYRSRSTYWAWTSDQWHDIVGASHAAYKERGAGSRSYARNGLLSAAYLLCDYHEVHALGKYDRVALAYRVFGRDRVDAEVSRVLAMLLQWGYSRFSRSGMRMAMCEVFIENRSPRLEDITYEVLDRLRVDGERFNRVRSCIHRLSRALAGLGIIPRALGMWGDGCNGVHGWATTGVFPQWTSYVERWYATTTISPKARKGYYRKLLLVGCWATITHPDAASPEAWGARDRRRLRRNDLPQMHRRLGRSELHEEHQQYRQAHQTSYSAPLPHGTFYFLS